MGELVCSGISKTYKNGATALDRVSFRIPTRGIFALIGRNGAGKTTIVRILATDLMPSSGSATINGVDVVKDAAMVREFVSIVPQEARLITWVTPKQMILSYLMYRGFTYKEAKKRAKAAVRRVKIDRYADKKSDKLSGGTKRKALVASVIASEAGVLFLDEPTTGLDPISRAELWNVLNDLKKDHFIFLTTHYLEEAERLADYIGIIENGKLLAMGTLDELRKKIRYEYSVKLIDKNAKLTKPRNGKVVVGLDGNKQILTSQREANSISKKLIEKGVRFSTSPISLEEIFYYIVKRNIDEDEENDGG
jgi:ABC-2 type transport system ATP-binding protein